MKTRVSLAGLLLLCAITTTALAQPSVDPQPLVGEWNGSWIDKRDARENGQYSLTIERVEGNKVYGHGTLYIRRSFDFKFVGTLDGNRLTWGTETKLEFTIDGTNMRGSSQGPTAARNITLSKQK